jgi:hypothetical protein
VRGPTRLVLGLVALAGVAAYVVYLRELDELVAPPRSPLGGAAPREPPPTTGEGARTSTAAERVTVVGRLVDAEGAPFAGLRVVASASGLTLEAESDAQGAFELPGLPRAELVLDPGVDFDPAEPLGVRRLAGQVAARTLDLATGPARVDLGALVLPRSRPFWIEGTVTLDEAWAREKDTWLGDVRLELAPPSPDDFVPPPPVPGAPPRPPWCDTLPAAPELGADGSFRFAVETPHDPFVLRARVQRFEPLERLLAPTPDGVHRETFLLPAGR